MHKSSLSEDRSAFTTFCLYGFRVPWTKKTTAFPVPDPDILLLSVGTTTYSELPFTDIEQAGKIFAKQSWIPCSIPSASSTINEALQLLRTDPNAFSDLGFLIRFRRSEVDEQSQPPEVQIRSFLGTPLGGIRVEDGASRLMLPCTSSLCVIWRPLFESIRSRFIEKGNFLDYVDLIEEKKKLRVTNEAYGCSIRLSLRNGECDTSFPFLHFRYGEKSGSKRSGKNLLSSGPIPKTDSIADAAKVFFESPQSSPLNVSPAIMRRPTSPANSYTPPYEPPPARAKMLTLSSQSISMGNLKLRTSDNALYTQTQNNSSSNTTPLGSATRTTVPDGIITSSSPGSGSPLTSQSHSPILQSPLSKSGNLVPKLRSQTELGGSPRV